MIDEVLSRLGAGDYSPTYEQPEDIIKRIVSFQKGQRAGPITEQLQGVGQGYAQATPEAQAQKNAKANALRYAWVQNGGNPYDLDTKLWGSDPSKGFQTGEGQFHTPKYNVEDNMTNAQKMQRAGITHMFEGKMTPDYRNLTADLTGVDPVTGKETPAYQLIKAQIDQKNNSGASDLSDWLFKQNYQNQITASENVAKNKTSALESAYKYIEGLDPEIDNTTGTVTKPGWSTNTKAQMKQIVSAMLNGMVDNGQSVNDVAAKIRAKYPKTADDIINALYNAESQLQLGK